MEQKEYVSLKKQYTQIIGDNYLPLLGEVHKRSRHNNANDINIPLH